MAEAHSGESAIETDWKRGEAAMSSPFAAPIEAAEFVSHASTGLLSETCFAESHYRNALSSSPYSIRTGA